MRKRKPLTDEDGEVRELLAKDLKRFRPIAEVVTPSLAAKLGIESRRREEPLSVQAAKPDHRARMKGAGEKATRTRKRRAAARKAAQTRRRSPE